MNLLIKTLRKLTTLNTEDITYTDINYTDITFTDITYNITYMF
jgi:hypothetical protein